eukprot:EC851294.1.p4 GENE.EC851294.1~~EC851294.1.p4  ORF type:complete len:59 (-),score=11.68 EC851294.1:281-457(-)
MLSSMSSCPIKQNPSHVVDGSCVQLRTRPVRRIDRGGDVDFAVVFAISNDLAVAGLFR